MPSKEHPDVKTLSSEERLAFYGALFAVAAVDGQTSREELELIYETVDTEGLSETARRRLYAHAIEPPALRHCLRTLSGAPEAVRHGLMLNLVEVAVSDYLLSEAEQEALIEAQERLNRSTVPRWSAGATGPRHLSRLLRNVRRHDRGCLCNRVRHGGGDDLLAAAERPHDAVRVPDVADLRSRNLHDRDGRVLSAEEDVSSFEELLSALEGTSGVLADTVDVPPLNVAGVRTSWQELQSRPRNYQMPPA